MNKKILKISLHTLMIITIGIQNSYAQPLQKKQRISLLTQKNDYLSQVPELSLIKKFLDDNIGDFEVTSKLFSQDSTTSRTFLKFSGERFLKKFEDLRGALGEKPYSQENRTLILKTLDSPITAQEFLSLIQLKMDPASPILQKYFDHHTTWEKIICTLLEQKSIKNIFIFQQISLALLIESLKSEHQNHSLDNKFYTNFLTNIFLIHLSSEIEKLQSSHINSQSTKQKKDDKLHILLNSLMTIIIHTKNSSQYTLKTRIDPLKVEKKIHQMYYWGQSYETQFHTEIHQIIAKIPNENYLLQMGYLLSDLIFQHQHDLMSHNLDRENIIMNAMNDYDTGDRIDDFQWESIPETSDIPSILNPTTNISLLIIQNIHRIFNDSSSKEKDDVLNDIVNIIYQFDSLIDLDDQLHTHSSYIALVKIMRNINTIVHHQSKNDVKNSLQYLKEIICILSDYPEINHNLYQKISHSINKSLRHENTQEQTTIKTSRILSQLNTSMAFEVPPHYQIAHFLLQENDLLKTPFFLKELRSTFSEIQLNEAIEQHDVRIRVPLNVLKNSFSSQYLQMVSQLSGGSFPCHSLFQKEFSHVSQEPTEYRDKFKESFVRSSLLIQHTLSFLASGQINIILKSLSRFRGYNPDNPHIPAQLEDFIDMVEKL
ncbi:MAG: hypothetical protein AB8C84_10190 [Oligoflexales bacterium]